MDNASVANQHICRKLVEREVLLCMSELTSKLISSDDNDYCTELETLSYGVVDYEEAANQAGIIIVEDQDGDEWCVDEGEYIKEKGRLADDIEDGEYSTSDVLDSAGGCLLEDNWTWQEVCESMNVDTDDFRREPLEYWAVSEFLARNLTECGEAVAEIYGIQVWGRCTSGQAISMDGVIERIASQMGILHGQQNEWKLD